MDTGLMTASDKLMYEMRQSRDEGKDISRYQSMMEEICALPPGPEKEERSLRCLNWMATLQPAADFPYVEPSDWEEILETLPSAARDAGVLPSPEENCLKNRLLGAWQGRAAGCLMGKPYECYGSREIRAYLGYQGDGKLPAFSYFRMTDDPVCRPFEARKELSEELLTGMPSDDDTNYTVLGDELLRRVGRNFTSLDVACLWANLIPAHRVCTAERVSYRNLLNRNLPPRSARVRNPYREWIGAQIRADYYGYVNPGDPLAAAHMAYYDAAMTHTANGIYGAMWVAAALALALVYGDARKAAEDAIAYIPPKSRLAEALRDALTLYRSGADWATAMETLRGQWNEGNFHEWSHVIPNAVIVLNCLLYGHDFGSTIGMAMLYGFDTDCNGATAGSIFGAAYGAGVIPEKWIAPMKDTLYTDIPGRYRVSLTEMAQHTFETIQTR